MSLEDPEGSKCSCWPGNLRCSISQSSCSGASPCRCNLFPSRRFLADLDEGSLCLEGLDSGSWPQGSEVSTMPLSAIATGPDNEQVSEFSILLESNAEIPRKYFYLIIYLYVWWLQKVRNLDTLAENVKYLMAISFLRTTQFLCFNY